MKKFKSLTLENFQSHEHTTIDFDENFTVIVGASDQGKSAIIRALKWVLFNEPQGDEFIRVGASEVRVTLTLDDGTVIIRERGKKNRYVLRQGEDEYVFESFGRGVPKEILNAHGITSVKLDENLSLRLPLSEQLDGPFLLSESKPTKAKTIGYLSGVNIIDKAIRDVSLEIKQKSAEERSKNESISRITGELKDFGDLDMLEQLLPKIKTEYNETEILKDKLGKLRVSYDKLDKLEARIEVDRRTENRLADLPEKGIAELAAVYSKFVTLSRDYARLKDIQKRTGISSAVLQNTRDTADISKGVSSLNDLSRRLGRMRDCDVKLKALNATAERCEASLKKLKACEDCHEHLQQTGAAVSNLAVLKSRFAKLSGIENNIRTARLREQRARDEKERYLTDYGKVLKDIGRCPVCGSRIDEHTAETIIAELR